MKKNITFSLLILIALIGYSQDATFTQFNAVPLYLNPGYTGSAGSPRLATSYRNRQNNQHQTSYISYDQTLSSIHGGIGLMVYHDYYNLKQSSNYKNTFYCGIAYAPKFKLSSKVAISPAIKIGYRRDDFDGEVFDYQPNVPGINMIHFSGYSNKVDVSLGVVINTKKLHFGFAANHLNETTIPNFLYEKFLLTKRYVCQFGYTFQKTNTSNFSITPSLMYQWNKATQQSYYSRLQTSLSLRYKFIVVGTGINTSESYNFLLGYYSKKIMIGYSYEPGLSPSPYNIEGHELSIRYILSPKKEEADIKPKQATKRHNLFRRNKKILQN